MRRPALLKKIGMLILGRPVVTHACATSCRHRDPHSTPTKKEHP